jgi:hypothetical protein
MPSFVQPALLWGLALAGLPVLIHLINILRHRRVAWAAMEFLLASQQRNRTRVRMKQLLLLAMRMAAIALIVLVLAGPLLPSRWGGLFGGGQTHHIVLLDDSFSMSDRWADTDAFQQAKRVVERIGTQAGRQAEPQTFTLLRFSRAGGTSPAAEPDFLKETADADLARRLRETLDTLEASHTAAGPLPALEMIGQLMGESEADRRIVYLVSDFRAREWNDPADLRGALARLSDAGAKLHLIDCVQTARPNLAIENLSPSEGTRAAGVPLPVEVTVKNFGDAPVKDVPVVIQADGLLQPAIKVARIGPGEAVTERFQVRFAAAGEHLITARLETDAVSADNTRYGIVAIPEDEPVLLLDGDPEAPDARYLSAALAPGGPVATGIRPRIEPPRYLSANPLDSFAAVYLLNVERLDRSAVEALERYLEEGGGVAVFLGDRCPGKLINEAWHRDGKGFFPVPLAGQAELPVDRVEQRPDLKVGRHPIFQIFAGERNSFVGTVMVERYFAVPEDWRPEPDSTTQVIARLRNGAPLAVERQFGRGRVVAFLTTAAPAWNNWARNNPSFVVAMLQLQAFISRKPAEETSKLVGAPLELKLDPSQYQSRVRFVAPGQNALPMAAVDAVPAADGSLAVSLPAADFSGVYETLLSRKDGTQEVRRFGFNVEAGEGDLKTLAGPQLAARLPGVAYEYEEAAMFEYAAEELAGYSLSVPLLFLLILLLIAEQILAWSASYHPPAREPWLAAGGAGIAGARRATRARPNRPGESALSRSPGDVGVKQGEGR